MKFPGRYLGDSVYASFDGWNICLHLDRHDQLQCIALEPEVLKALNEYNEEIHALIDKEKNDG